MKLNKYRLGDLIEWSDERNDKSLYNLSNLKGISVKKEFIETKADMKGVSLKPYKVVKSDFFAYVPITSRNSNKITLAHNTSNETYIVSSSYIVFKISKPDVLNSDYLFMFFNRPEFDRYARFNSWGSAREAFSWQEMCDIEIELPPLEVQNKFVVIYKNILKNQKSYDERLDKIKLAAIGSLENTRNGCSKIKLGDLIEQTTDINSDLKYGSDDVKGMTITKQIIPTKANANESDLSKYLIIHNDEFIYNPRTHGKKIGLGFNNTNKDIIISWNNIGFRIKDSKKNVILPDYLYLIFTRDEWDRRACQDSWGSSTEVFSWNSLCDIEIELPSLEVQKYVSMLNNSYINSYNINEKLKELIKNICPILIKGSKQ